MQTYEILISLVLPALVFGQNCPTMTHDEFSLDVKKTEEAGATIELILEMKLKYSRDCNMACCVYSTSAQCSIAVFDTKNGQCALYRSNCEKKRTCVVNRVKHYVTSYIERPKIAKEPPGSKDNDKSTTLLSTLTTETSSTSTMSTAPTTTSATKSSSESTDSESSSYSSSTVTSTSSETGSSTGSETDSSTSSQTGSTTSKISSDTSHSSSTSNVPSSSVSTAVGSFVSASTVVAKTNTLDSQQNESSVNTSVNTTRPESNNTENPTENSTGFTRTVDTGSTSTGFTSTTGTTRTSTTETASTSTGATRSTNSEIHITSTSETTERTGSTGSSIESSVTSSESTISHESTESTTLNIENGDANTTKKSPTRFHYPHFESPESAAISGALIAAVSFGVIFLFSILVLVGKRCFDSWQRRHYSRMDYLINGMYN